jgi:hypothetical protein
MYAIINEWPDAILRYVLTLNSIEDGELAVAALGFVRDLANRQWPPFFECFDLEFLLAPLTSVDVRIIEVCLEIWACIICLDPVRPVLERIIATIVNGMFTNFEPVPVRRSLELLFRVIQGELCSPDDMVRLILQNVKFQSKEARDFAEMFVGNAHPDALVRQTLKMIAVYKKPM